MTNVAHRHRHACPDCGQPWECYIPGGCRDDRDRQCPYCEGDEDDDFEEDDE